jgi:uncharacterized protein (TIRG00374 family)
MNYKTLLKIALTVILVGIILNTIGIKKLLLSFQGINIYLFIFAFLLSPPVVLLGTEKWRQIIKHEAKGIEFKNALVSFLGGMSLGLLTPGRVGEIGRILFIKKGGKGALVGIALVDKFIDLQITLFICIFSAFIFLGHIFTILLFCGVIFGFIIIFYPKTFSNLFERIATLLPFKDKINKVLTGAINIPRKSLTVCLFYRLIVSLTDIFQFWLLLNSFMTISLVNVAAVYPLIILSSVLQLTFGNIGIREGLSILTLSKFGVSPEVSANASFLLFTANTLIPSLCGAFFIPSLRIND